MQDSTPPAPSISSARRALQAGQSKIAIAHLKEILATGPSGGEAYELLGIAHFLAGDHASARQALAQATRREPGRATAHYNYALVLVEDNELDDADEELRTALYLAPKHAGAIALQKKLAERLHDRRYVAPEGFSISNTPAGPRCEANAPWGKLECASCGAKNFVTARTCSRCGSYLPEEEPVYTVE